MAKNSGQRQPGQIRANLWWADDTVKELAQRVIEECHERLKPGVCAYPIKYVMQGGGLKVRGKDAWAKTEIVSGKAAALHEGLPLSDVVLTNPGKFFLITLSSPAWRNFNEARKLAVLDSALTSCGISKKGLPMIVKPDVEEHSAVIERRGFYRRDLKLLGQVCARVSAQTTIDFDAEDEPKVSALEAAAEEAKAEVAAEDAEVNQALAASLSLSEVCEGCGEQVASINEDAYCAACVARIERVEAASAEPAPEADWQAEKAAALDRAEEARSNGQSFEQTREQKRNRRLGHPVVESSVPIGAAA